MLSSLKRRGETIIVAAIVGAVAAGGPAVAGGIVDFAKSSGNANRVNKIGASKTPRAGMLLPLNAKGQFPAGVLAAGRGATGSTGPTGAQGPQGAPGAAGANGASGSQGAKGATGAAGTDGAAGPPGPKGDTGNAGTNGTDGAAGPPGPKGDTGNAGTNGTDGANGAAGPPGPKGNTGNAGTNGTDGANGAAGPPGPKGDTGNAGTNGAAGAQGPKGDTGNAGTNGTDGANGAAGAQGPKGDQGDQGPAGGLVYPALVDVNPVPQATASHKWDNLLVNSGSWNNGYRSSHTNGDQTSSLEWLLPLAAGTWTLEVTHATDQNAGILTFYLDDGVTPIGTVDGYTPGIELNHRGVVSNIAVGPSGMHTLRVRTETKNPASSNYYGYLVWLRLVKQ